MDKSILKTKIVVLVVMVALCVIAGADFLRMHEPDKLFEGNPALSEKRMLSDYHPDLKDTPQDSPIYVFDSGNPGGSMLILGGTHGNELAGVLSAVLFVENVKVNAGKLYVIPHTDASSFTHTQPLYGYMDSASFELPDGSERTFRIGTRLGNPLYQWPDESYHQGNSGRVLKTAEVSEARNMNRNYPGDINGTLMEKACYAVYNLVKTEDIDLLYDAHEAGPTFARVDYLIAHENADSVASMGVMNAQLEGVNANLDGSGPTSYGLTHRSLGDNTDAYCTLFESLNPSMGLHHSKTTREMVLGGVDPNGMLMSEWGLTPSCEITEEGSSINKRTAIHMSMCMALADALTLVEPENQVVLAGMPSYDECIGGLAQYLKPIQ